MISFENPNVKMSLITIAFSKTKQNTKQNQKTLEKEPQIL